MTVDQFYQLAQLEGYTRLGDDVLYYGPAGCTSGNAGANQYEMAFSSNQYGMGSCFLKAGYLDQTRMGELKGVLRWGKRCAEEGFRAEPTTT